MAIGRKTGGRVKGSINKTTAVTKEVISDMLANYRESGLMDSDFMQLEPKDRLLITEKLMQYIMPKIQAVDMNMVADIKERTIEDKLIALSQSHKK